MRREPDQQSGSRISARGRCSVVSILPRHAKIMPPQQLLYAHEHARRVSRAHAAADISRDSISSYPLAVCVRACVLQKRYIASNDDDDERRDRRAEAKPQAEVLPTASNTFPSSALAGALGLGTYAIAEFTTRRISEWRQTLPDVRALRNLVTATSTLAEGLLYLLAFVFIISGVGIFMLGVQTVLRGADADADADRIDIANSDDNDNPMND